MAPPLDQPSHSTWFGIGPFVAGLIAVHVFALLFWIFQVVRSSTGKAKPAGKQE